MIVDTDVVSYIVKQDTRAALYRPHLFNAPKLISFMTLAELRRWALQSNWGQARRKKLEEAISDYGVIYANDELCQVWAEIMNNSRKKGRPIETADAWIAATALLFAVPLVTHNRAHFADVDNLIVVSEAS